MLFIDSLNRGGSQRQFLNLAVGLQQRGYDVEVTTLFDIPYHQDRLDQYSISNTPLYKRGRFDLRPVVNLGRRVSRSRPEVLIAFLRTPSLYAEMIRLGGTLKHTTLIVSERGGVPPQGLSRLSRYLLQTHRLADHIVCNSQHFRRFMTEVVPSLKAKSSTIDNGIEQTFFANGEQRLHRDATIASPIAEPGSTRLCVVATRPSREKGMASLIHAMIELKRRGELNLTVDWVGNSDSQHDTVIEASQLLHAHQLQAHWNWHGVANPIDPIYLCYDGIVVPSLHEGVPNALCEAMASALPAIATRIADNERIIEDRVNGVLCAVEDPISMADALSYFCSLGPHAQREMGRAAWQRARNLFAMDHYLDRWEAAMHNCTSAYEKC